MMERVIRGGFGLLLALTLPIWSAQGEQVPEDNRPDFDVVPRNAARTVLLHAATPECDTVHCCLSIEAGQPRARGDYEIVLSCNQYADRIPTIVTKEGTQLTWIRSASSGSWSDGKPHASAGTSIASLPPKRASTGFVAWTSRSMG